MDFFHGSKKHVIIFNSFTEFHSMDTLGYIKALSNKHLGDSNFLLLKTMVQGTYLYKNLFIVRYFYIIIPKRGTATSIHILNYGGYFQITLPNDCTNFHSYHITILFTEHTVP